MKKKCNLCKKTKTVSLFYKDKKGKYGRSSRCMECAKKTMRERTARLSKNPEWVKANRERNREKYHRLSYREKYKPSSDIEKRKEKLYRYRYPEKYKARSMSVSIRSINGNHNHHWSYNEQHWKDVISLAPADHHLLHRYIKYDQERMMYRRCDCGILLDTKQSHIDLLEHAKKIENLKILNQTNKWGWNGYL